MEVKAGNTVTPSLNRYIKDYNLKAAYKLIGGRNGKVGVKETLPHYMIIFCENLFAEISFSRQKNEKTKNM